MNSKNKKSEDKDKDDDDAPKGNASTTKEQHQQQQDAEQGGRDHGQHPSSTDTSTTTTSTTTTTTTSPPPTTHPISPRPPIQADDRLRVLAYSDSDSDVESHFQRVKDHLLPGHDAEARAAEEAAEEEVRVEEERRLQQQQSSTSGRALTRLAAAVSGAVSHVVPHLTPSIILKAGVITVLRGVNQKVGVAAEAAGFVAGAAGFAMQRRLSPSSSSSGSVHRLQSHAIEFGKATALIAVLRLAQQAQKRAGKRSRRLVHRLMSGVNLSALDHSISSPTKPPETAAEWAEVYCVEMLEMRRMLSECGIDLTQDGRWDESNAELMRFAEACGLKAAETPVTRGVALEKAVKRVLATVDWSASTALMSETKLRRWERLVSWRGSDASGHPILLVRFGRALQLCTKSGRLESFVEAILAQVENGVRYRLNNGPEGPEKIVAVVDCRETSNWETFMRSRSIMSFIKKLVTDIAGHYPERLERVYLLEVPLLGRMAVQSVLSTLAPSTKEKVISASTQDDSLPVTVALLQKKRSYALLGRSMSDVSLATTEESRSPRRTEDDDDEGDEEEGREEGEDEYFGSPKGEHAGDEQEEGGAGVMGASTGASVATNDSIIMCNGGGEEPSVAQHGAATATGLHPVVIADSPLTEDVATNLLDALDEVASGARGGGTAGTAGIVSHAVEGTLGTPSTLSPQSSQGAASGAEVVDSMLGEGVGGVGTEEEGEGEVVSVAASTSSAAGVYNQEEEDSVTMTRRRSREENPPPPSPFHFDDAVASTNRRTVSAPPQLIGATAMLKTMLPSTAHPQQQQQQQIRSPRLRAHRLQTLSTENSLSSAPGTPSASAAASGTLLSSSASTSAAGKGARSGSSTSTSSKMGGLKELPPRPTSSRKTPAKSSLRRPEAPNETLPRLSSFPLRRQTSVSWAEHLESVREIYRTPQTSMDGGQLSAGGRSGGEGIVTPPGAIVRGGAGVGVVVEDITTTTPSPLTPGAQVVIVQPEFPGLIVVLMVLGLLQRLLLGV